MSLPTYIRRRRTPNPAVYLAQRLGPEMGLDMPRANRVLQILKEWERDFDGYYINPTKRHVRPFWLVPTLADEQVVEMTAAGTAGATVKGISFEVDTQGHFEIASAMFVATSNNFVVEIFDPNLPRFLQNAEVHARAVGGTARRPFLWPESYFVNVQEAKRTIQMNFRNLSAAPNDVRWCFHGRRWYHKEAIEPVQRAIEQRFARMEKTYTYFMTLDLGRSKYSSSTAEGANPPAITLAASQTLQENSAPMFFAGDEADTEVHKLTVFATGAFEFQLRERQSGRILSNGFVHQTQGWGDGEFPFPLAETFLFERNYDLLFEVRDLSGAENKIFPVLTGRRLQYA